MDKVTKIVAKCIEAVDDLKGNIICKFDKSLDVLSWEFAAIHSKVFDSAGRIDNDYFKIINLRISDNDAVSLLNEYCIIDCHIYYTMHWMHFTDDIFNILKTNTATLLWKELGELQNPTIEQIDMYQEALNGI